MGKIRDLTGQKFGKLTVLYMTGERTKSRHIVWRCVCDCGNEISLPGSALTSGNTNSCGCLRNGGVGGGIGGGEPIDHTGKRYGRLVAIERVGRSEDRNSLWLLKCDCGNTCVKDISILQRGDITSCGCRFVSYDHKYKRLHDVYHGIKSRCYYTYSVSYPWYGARGIKMCDEWLSSFEAFRSWAMDNGYQLDAQRGVCTIDRIDPDGDYEPSNCRWITIAEQQRNKSGVNKVGKQPSLGF